MRAAETLAAVRTALVPVLADIAETLKYHGSLAPTAYVLPDWTGRSLTTVSLAANSGQNRQLSVVRVQATIVEKQAVAVVWAQDAWETDPRDGVRRPVVRVEVQTQTGHWYRLQALIVDDDGDATIDESAALARLQAVDDRLPLFAVAFAP